MRAPPSAGSRSRSTLPRGSVPRRSAGFGLIADLTKGAVLPFDASSAGRLRELLGAVAAYVTGGLEALADQRPEIVALLIPRGDGSPDAPDAPAQPRRHDGCRPPERPSPLRPVHLPGRDQVRLAGPESLGGAGSPTSPRASWRMTCRSGCCADPRRPRTEMELGMTAMMLLRLAWLSPDPKGQPCARLCAPAAMRCRLRSTPPTASSSARRP